MIGADRSKAAWMAGIVGAILTVDLATKLVVQRSMQLYDRIDIVGRAVTVLVHTVARLHARRGAGVLAAVGWTAGHVPEAAGAAVDHTAAGAVPMADVHRRREARRTARLNRGIAQIVDRAVAVVVDVVTDLGPRADAGPFATGAGDVVKQHDAAALQS